MANPAEEAQEKIEARLGEIRSEEERLNRALVHLKGSSTGSPGKSRSTRKSTGGKGVKRGQRQAEVIEDIENHPQALPREISSRTGISVGQIYGIVNRLGGRLNKQANGGYVVRKKP